MRANFCHVTTIFSREKIVRDWNEFRAIPGHGNSYDRRNSGSVMYAAMKTHGIPGTAHKISINRVSATELNGNVNAVFSGPAA